MLDKDARLVAVGGDWERFAIANGAPELAPPGPLGRPIESFISDATTAHIYRELFDKTRRTGVPVSFPIRCDSPEMVRELELTISATGDGHVVHSALVREQHRSILPSPLTPAWGVDAVITVCGWCKRVDAGGRWLEPEDAVAELALFRLPALPGITHGICEECLQLMEGLLSD